MLALGEPLGQMVRLFDFTICSQILRGSLPSIVSEAWISTVPEQEINHPCRPAKRMPPQGRASGGKRVHLARILWHLLKFKEPFNPEVFAQAEEKMKRKQLARLQNLAANLNYQLLPNP